MAKIKAFRAHIYNKEKVKDISLAVCPPYDVISSEDQAYYHDASPYNLIHLLLGKDIQGEDKYRRAKDCFQEWVKSGILVRDKDPAIYFYSQEYKLKGEKKVRLGFISLLRLSDDDSSVFKHEHTRVEPKTDRFNLLKQVKANLSPIFAVFLDKNRLIQRVYQKCIQENAPFIDITDKDNVKHKLWRIESPEFITFLESGMLKEDIFIADGHHRYEVACAYRDLMRQKLKDKITGEEPFNYLLAYFTNTDSRGLSILPVHRYLCLDGKKDFDDFKLKLKEYFEVDEVKDKTRFFYLMQKGGRSEHVLGIYKDKKFYLLRLKNIKILDKMINDKPKAYRSLDVSVLNHIILKHILNFGAQDMESLIYSPYSEEFIEKADNDPKGIVFFLNPVKIQQIVSVALNQERMPPKSTYFYPKVLSGLVINKLSEA